MPKILQLDSHVADLIAAGEVVERPASVVKELLDNSIDAGAGIVTVEIVGGGRSYIRISDNGCGIAPEDVKTAFLRHATSKLNSADGLEAIGTLGFRGEALAAIAAVSRIELLTRESGAKEGVCLRLEAGEVVDFSPAGAPEGTTIIVRDLFFNTPARHKFMKSDRTEGSAVASAVLKAALARPDVSVKFIKDGVTEYHTPGDSLSASCIYSLFGREFAAGLFPVDSSDETFSVTGFVSSPDDSRGNRSYQYFFVNGRPIKSITLQMALEKAFSNLLASGRFPSCILYLTTRLGDVDVNVHPAKTEIKFVSDKAIFDGVYYAVLSALERGGASISPSSVKSFSEAGTSGLPGGLLLTGAGNYNTATHANALSGGFSERGTNPSFSSPKGNSGAFKSMQVEEYRNRYGSPGRKNEKQKDDAAGSFFPDVMRNDASESPPFFAPKSSVLSEGNNGLSDPDDFLPRFEGFSPGCVIIGEVFHSYIIAEYNSSVWFIDKHAAHERLHFNALRSEGFEPMSQNLLSPVVCRLGPEQVSLLLENADFLEGLGFSVESFGEDCVAVRHIPSEIGIEDTESILAEIGLFLTQGALAEASKLDEIYRMIACKASIKAGKSSSRSELELLASKVFSGEASHCPHGRPVFFEMSKADLDKRFKRN